MQLSCLQENLFRGISLVGHLALRQSSLPILNNILIKATKGLLTLTTTNLEVGIHHNIRGKIKKEGECLVQARLLLDLLPFLPTGAIELTMTEGGLKITAPKIETTLRTTPPTDFPIIPSIDQPQCRFSVPAKQFAEILNKTSFAVGRIEHRPQFGGVLLIIEEQRLIAVATDGYRLAEASSSLPKATTPLQVIIPATAIQEVQRLLNQTEEGEAIELNTTENQVNFSTNTSLITSRVIDGAYPDYKPLFPEKALTECLVDKANLTRAIKAAALFSRSGIFDISLFINTKQSALEIFSENSDAGSHRTTIEAEGVGDPLTITINARYLLDGLNATASSSVKLSLTGADRPILLQPSQDNNGIQFRYLVVPIKQI